MLFATVVLGFFFTTAFAGDLEGAYHYGGEYASSYDNYEPHDYQFEYSVSDPHTGDHKSQYEHKQKGVVRGFYSLLEPDGTTRIVEYIADKHGFRAEVKKIGHGKHETTYHGLYDEGYKGVYDGQAYNYKELHQVHPTEHHIEPIIVQEEEEHHVPSIQTYSSHSPIATEYILVKPYQPTAEIHGYSGYSGNHGSSEIHSLGATHHQTSEIHGFTGNPDDDSSYTNYDSHHDHEEYGNSYGGGGYPAVFAWAPLPYKTANEYIQPFSYHK